MTPAHSNSHFPRHRHNSLRVPDIAVQLRGRLEAGRRGLSFGRAPKVSFARRRGCARAVVVADRL